MGKLKGILKSVTVSYGVALILLSVFAFVLTYSPMPDSAVMPAVTVVTIVSVTLCGIWCARGQDRLGYLFGGIGGLVYVILLVMFATLILNDYSFSTSFLTLLALGVLCGAFGGMIGINIRNKNKRKER